MKIFKYCLMAAIMVFSFALPSLAVDNEVGEEDSNVSDTAPVVVYASVADNPDYELTDTRLLSVSPVTSSSSSGLKSALLGVLGDYDAIVVEYEYTSTNGYTSYLREVQPDYVWISSAALLALVIYCLFRLGGCILNDR